MDARDEYILTTLLKNGRASITSIAKELGVTETAVRKRIIKLERIGAIKSYSAIIDPHYMGYEGVALVGIDATPENILNVYEEIKKFQNVKYVALTSGDHMIMFEIWCKTPEKLQVSLKKIENIYGVTRLCPAILIKKME